MDCIICKKSYNKKFIVKCKICLSQFCLDCGLEQGDYYKNKFSECEICRGDLNLQKYLKTVKHKIKIIFKRRVSSKLIRDILDTEFDIKSSIVSLRVKQKQMRHGEIWQILIGSMKGFRDLRYRHETGLDIISESKKIIMEVKNRYNTDNSSAKKSNFDKLAKFKLKNPDYKCIYAVVNARKPCGEYKIIKHNGIKIHYCSGDTLLDFIFGKNKNLIINYAKKIIYKYNTKLK